MVSAVAKRERGGEGGGGGREPHTHKVTHTHTHSSPLLLLLHCTQEGGKEKENWLSHLLSPRSMGSETKKTSSMIQLA